MNIIAISTILKELAFQSSNLTSSVAKAESAKPAAIAVTTKTVAEAAAPISNPEQSHQADKSQKIEQPIFAPTFVPIPLRSELYTNAMFFARIGDDAKESAGKKEIDGEIFMCIFTENLGQLWIGLAKRKDSLFVRCFTAHESLNKILRENFYFLREALINIGFKEAFLTCQARTDLGTIIEEQLPKLEQHLLDRKI
ncbi:MAG: flagellar hook-length control protein FliK [Pelotomaculum sp.]